MSDPDTTFGFTSIRSFRRDIVNFGKLERLDEKSFGLPPDHPLTTEVLQNLASPEPVKLYVGGTAWSNPEWKGMWYARNTRPAEYMQAYCRLFQTIEFNTTHYRIPGHSLVDRWYHESTEGFQFCPKLPQAISHRGRISFDSEAEAFCNSISRLHEKLGPCFIQLSERTGPEHAASILSFLNNWPSEIRLHWEFRHPAWFQGGEQAELVWDELWKHGHGTVITDVCGRRDVAHMRLTNGTAMLRFVGNGLHPTDYQRAEDWVKRLSAWSGNGLQACHLFVHQPESSEVPAFSAWLATRLQEILSVPVFHPIPLQVKTNQPTLFDLT